MLTKIPKFVTPNLERFPEYLKDVESRWGTKLVRRFDRERYVGSKEEQLPRYILSMFPYPSGKLHLGHVRIYTSGDILARFSRLMSKNKDYRNDYNGVVNPMGFDSFGLPAENAARERGLDPADWTNTNIKTMKSQLDDLALQFDWREATSNPSFYKWTQEIFLRLMDAGLVYKSFAHVNWDPIDKTVLADEQVDEEGRSWRSGALVEKRNFRQWFIKVNAFADAIYKAEDIEPETWGDILAIQRNWTGKPCGWLFYIPVSKSGDVLTVFTKNPGSFVQEKTKLIISPDHWLEKIYHASKISGIYNPFRGDYMRVEISSDGSTLTTSHARLQGNCDNQLAHEQVLFQAKLNGLGGHYTSENYRDWLISRQRYWGTPIPAVNCGRCGFVGVSRNTLPINLPKIQDLSLKATTDTKTIDENKITSPIEELAPQEWINTKCPSCAGSAKRECETFDTLFDSSWYFLRYATSPPKNSLFNLERVQPVWCYIGGKEHASMHLFYARFITHFLHSQGLLKFKEPFKKLLVQGVVKSKTYKLGGRYLTHEEVKSLTDKSKLSIDYEKMSKSKGNGIDPQELLDKFGVDATRFCLMSYANPRSERLWRSNEEEFKDVLQFLRRVVLTVQEYIDIGLSLVSQQTKQLGIKELSSENLERSKNLLIESRNTSSINAIFYIQETCQFRQFISVMHSLLSSIRTQLKTSAVYTVDFAEALAALIVMLNPVTPHLSEELWLIFSKCRINPLRSKPDSKYNILLQSSDQPWPTPDPEYPLQIKIRATSSQEYVEKIPITREDLRISSDQDLAQIVSLHFKSKGDTCQVKEVSKFDDLMAIVVAELESVNKKTLEKRKKKQKSAQS